MLYFVHPLFGRFSRHELCTTPHDRHAPACRYLQYNSFNVLMTPAPHLPALCPAAPQHSPEICISKHTVRRWQRRPTQALSQISSPLRHAQLDSVLDRPARTSARALEKALRRAITPRLPAGGPCASCTRGAKRTLSLRDRPDDLSARTRFLSPDTGAFLGYSGTREPRGCPAQQRACPTRRPAVAGIASLLRCAASLVRAATGPDAAAFGASGRGGGGRLYVRRAYRTQRRVL